MSPKDKAKELVEKFHEHSYNPSPYFNTSEEGSHDKQCALLCVEEIIKVCLFLGTADYRIPYWNDVKKEIENL